MRPVLALLLALAASAQAAVVNEYESREEYAALNNVELSAVLKSAKTPAACKSKKTFLKDTDLFKGDIRPTREIEVDYDVGGGDVFPDTVVAASTAESCCTMCHLNPDCGAFTFTGPENCASAETPWLFNATLQTGEPGCCYLKYSTGFIKQKTGAKGHTSGILPPRTAPAKTPQCKLLLETDTQGADLTFDPILPDLVVAGSGPSDCCAACASIEGCFAFTLTPARYCEFRLGAAAAGCCFLKPKHGWKAVSDESTLFFTSGVLL